MIFNRIVSISIPNTTLTTMVTVQDINDTWADESNGIIAAIISFFFNVALIFATSRVKIYNESVKRMQIFACVLRLLFSTSIVLSSPTLAYITEAEAVYIVKGGFKLPIWLGDQLLGAHQLHRKAAEWQNISGTAILITFITFVIFSCMGPPMQFLQVLLIVKKNVRYQKNIVFFTTLASFLVAFTATILLYIGYTPDISDDRLSQEIVYNLNGKGQSAYLIASLERFDYALDDWVPDPISWICTLYILLVLVLSTVISLVCWVMIRCQIGKGIASSNSVKVQLQLTTVLVVQFTIPFLTIHIPFYFSFIMPLFRIETSLVSIYLPYLFSWCPALNPIVVLIMVKSIREKIFVRPKRNSLKNSSAANVNIKAKTKG